MPKFTIKGKQSERLRVKSWSALDILLERSPDQVTRYCNKHLAQHLTSFDDDVGAMVRPQDVKLHEHIVSLWRQTHGEILVPPCRTCDGSELNEFLARK